MLTVRGSFLALRRLPSSSSPAAACASLPSVFRPLPRRPLQGSAGDGCHHGCARFSSGTGGGDADDHSGGGGDDNSVPSAPASSSGYLTGTVKFYIRSKGYGFIVPDDPLSVPHSAPEVWVHRTSLDTPHLADEYPTRPYLYKDERVKFRVVGADNNNNDDGHRGGSGASPKAVGVLFENGRQVPLFRKNYQAAVVRGECMRLGQTVLDILQAAAQEDENDDENDNESKMKVYGRIKDAAAVARETIRLAQQRQETTVGDNGREGGAGRPE